MKRVAWLSGLVACAIGSTAWAQRAPFESVLTPDEGKLPLTAGFSDVEGAGGGGLVPWATITGYGTSDSWGANAHYTFVPLRDFQLKSYGVAVGALDRFEVSLANDEFTAKGTALNGLTIQQHVVGAKVKLTGDAVYDQDSWLPQTAVGFEYKRNTGISDVSGVTNAKSLGADGTSGTDWYLSATKVYLAQSVLVNLTLRYTKANELGLLGFGGDLKSGRSVEPEMTLAYIFTRTLAAGFEYRAKPHNLSIDDEHDGADAFVAWNPTRHVSVLGAYVRLGGIVAPVTGQARDQQGGYISVQVGF